MTGPYMEIATAAIAEIRAERDAARDLARELLEMLAAFPTVKLLGIREGYPWLAEREGKK